MKHRPTNAPTRFQFEAAVERARAAGRQAAEGRYLELALRLQAQEPLLEASGGALLVVKADGRTALGRLLGALSRNPIPGVSITRIRRAQYMVNVEGVCRYQGESLNEAAERAVLGVLRDELGVEVCMKRFVD